MTGESARAPSLPTLKVVVGWSERRHLCDLLGEALRAIACEKDVRRLGDESYLVCTERTAAEVRDALRETLAEGESVFVVEFEKWSGSGPGIDSAWLLARGH